MITSPRTLGRSGEEYYNQKNRKHDSFILLLSIYLDIFLSKQDCACQRPSWLAARLRTFAADSDEVGGLVLEDAKRHGCSERSEAGRRSECALGGNSQQDVIHVKRNEIGRVGSVRSGSKAGQGSSTTPLGPCWGRMSWLERRTNFVEGNAAEVREWGRTSRSSPNPWKREKWITQLPSVSCWPLSKPSRRSAINYMADALSHCLHGHSQRTCCHQDLFGAERTR